ncbi:MAG TPA: HAD-IIB family hydrolase [Deltaproteobacteria bacterium]|nr:HAD-IIB family hydrolase [Deltaproteobacteria bacterium]
MHSGEDIIMSMLNHSGLLIFTDLDGTLLDYHTYSKEPAKPALNMLEDLNIPLIIVSSKTRAEIEPLLDMNCMTSIFIVENGSAIFLRQDIGLRAEQTGSDLDKYHRVVLGEQYNNVLEALQLSAYECNVRIRGFSDMSIATVSKITGLDMEGAARAKQREFSEAFLFEDDPAKLASFTHTLEKKGFTCIEGGRFLHALGRCDKGQALERVLNIYSHKHPQTSWQTIALGDSANDHAMLAAANIAVVIRRHDGTYMDYPAQHNQRVIKPHGIGPAGWNEAIMQILNQTFKSG